MAQFDKQISISLDPQSAASIGAALAEYVRHIDDGRAFRLDSGLIFDIEFVDLQGKPLTSADAGAHRDLLDTALRTARTNRKYSYISEPVLIAAALNFPEMEPLLEQWAQAVVSFAQNRNDAMDMMLDDFNVFAVEGLYMLAVKKPEMSRYLAQFAIPYWDLYSFSAPVQLLPKLIEQYGWRREMVQAYLWCDSESVRRGFFSFDGEQTQASLLSHLEANQQDYLWFKQALRERLLARPLLAYHSDADECDPVLTFFYSLADWSVNAESYETEQWRDEVQQQQIWGERIEDAALGIWAELRQNGQEREFVAVAPALLVEDAYAQWQIEPQPADAGDEAQAHELLSEPQIQWDESSAKSFFYCLHPRGELLTQKRLERLSEDLGYRNGQEIIEALPFMPVHLGCAAYLALRLHHKPGSDERHAILAWFEQHLSQLLAGMVFDASNAKPEECEPLRRWLSLVEADIETQSQLDKEMLELVATLIKRGGGKSGNDISAKQAAYWCLFSHDGYQRGLLTLLLLQSCDQLEPNCQSVLLARRHWRLWLTLAPQRVINRIVKFKADYALYAAIDDEETETALFNLLLQHGVSETMLEAFTLMADQQVADYRPAHPRFAARYAQKVALYAELEANDTSMIGRHQWLQFEALLRQLEYCHEEQLLTLMQHIRALNPEAELPVASLFETSMMATLKEGFDDATSQMLYDGLMDYLHSGEGLAGLSPQALKLPRLQGWNPYPMYRGKVGPADFIWLLPAEMAERLALFLAQLGKRGLHWLTRSSVQEAYVSSRIQNGELSLAERWSHGEVGNCRHADIDISLALDSAKQSWALDWLDSIGVPEQSLVYFAVHEGQEQQAFVRRLAAENRLPDMQAWLTSAERIRLLGMLEGGDTPPQAVTQSLIQDYSSAVKQLARKLFGYGD